MKKISTLLLCIVLAAALALAATAVGCKSSGTDKPNENQGDNDMNNDKNHCNHRNGKRWGHEA